MQGLLRGEKPGCPGSKAGSCSGWERLPRWPSRERQSPRQELEGDPPNTDPASQRPGTGSSHRKASSKPEGDPLTQGLPQTTCTAGPLGATLRPFAGGRWHQPSTSFFACHQPHGRLGGPDGANVQGLTSLSRELGAEADAGERQRAPRSHTVTPLVAARTPRLPHPSSASAGPQIMEESLPSRKLHPPSSESELQQPCHLTTSHIQGLVSSEEGTHHRHTGEGHAAAVADWGEAVERRVTTTTTTTGDGRGRPGTQGMSHTHSWAWDPQHPELAEEPPAPVRHRCHSSNRTNTGLHAQSPPPWL